jgi:putative membrane protein
MFQPRPFPLPVTLAFALAALIYFRGWLRLRKALPNSTSALRLAAFVSGLFSAWIAVGSPLAALDDALLTVHMLQHILLMTVASPLILLGAPARPLQYGLLQRFVSTSSLSFVRWPAVRRLGRFLTDPAVCWLAAMGALVGWHVPAVFNLAMRSEWWHAVEHADFLVSGLLFWWPVVQPWPSVARWPRWRIPVYLFFATLPCDLLSAFLTFCDRVVYTGYLTAPRLLDLSPLQDQECAGAVMWVSATFIYLIPAVVVTVQLLSPSGLRQASEPPGISDEGSDRQLPIETEAPGKSEIYRPGETEANVAATPPPEARCTVR